MRCPFCRAEDDKVVDSRPGDDGASIRRRRECLACKRRYTTYERIEEELPLVVKRDGRREAFDRQKVLTGILKACEKRPISYAAIEKVVDRVSAEFHPLARDAKDIGSAAVFLAFANLVVVWLLVLLT